MARQQSSVMTNTITMCLATIPRKRRNRHTKSFRKSTSLTNVCLSGHIFRRCAADSDLDSNSYAAQRNVDAMLAASETYKAVSWGTRYMGMDRLKAEVSEYKLDAKVNVAVIDSGVNSSDTLFEGRINEEDSMNCCEGEDRSDYGDNMGHGSHVAGIIADATPDNVQLTIIKCFTSQGATTVSTVQQGIMGCA